MSMLKQLLQWPPTVTTVIGLGLVLAGIDYALTGSTAQALLVAGLFKIVCPQDGAAVDQLTGYLRGAPGTMRALAYGLVVTTLLAMSACSSSQQQAVTGGLQTATAACQAAQPIVAVVPQALAGILDQQTQATIANLLAYEQSVCSSTAAIASAVGSDASGGTGTAAWITNIAGGLIKALPAILALVG